MNFKLLACLAISLGVGNAQNDPFEEETWDGSPTALNMTLKQDVPMTEELLVEDALSTGSGLRFAADDLDKLELTTKTGYFVAKKKSGVHMSYSEAAEVCFAQDMIIAYVEPGLYSADIWAAMQGLGVTGAWTGIQGGEAAGEMLIYNLGLPKLTSPPVSIAAEFPQAVFIQRKDEYRALFDGSQQALAVGMDVYGAGATGASVTISFDVYLTSGAVGKLINFGSDSFNYFYIRTYTNSANANEPKLAIFWMKDSSGALVGGSTSQTLSLNTWYTLDLTISATTVYLKINGGNAWYNNNVPVGFLNLAGVARLFVGTRDSSYAAAVGSLRQLTFQNQAQNSVSNRALPVAQSRRFWADSVLCTVPSFDFVALRSCDMDPDWDSSLLFSVSGTKAAGTYQQMKSGVGHGVWLVLPVDSLQNGIDVGVVKEVTVLLLEQQTLDVVEFCTDGAVVRQLDEQGVTELVDITDGSVGAGIVLRDRDCDGDFAQLDKDGSRWGSCFTAPLTLIKPVARHSYKVQFSVCDVNHAEKLAIAPLVLKLSGLVSGEFVEGDWLTMYSGALNFNKVYTLYANVERAYDTLLMVEIRNDLAEAVCVDSVVVDGVQSQSEVQRWIATGSAEEMCVRIGCQPTMRAIFEWQICSIQVLNLRAVEVEGQPQVATSSMTGFKCKNYGRFVAQSCEISQEFATESATEISSETGHETSDGSSWSRDEESHWDVSATAGFGIGWFSAEVTASGGESTTNSKGGERTQATSTSTGESVSQSSGSSVNCAAAAEIPPGHELTYDLVFQERSTVQEFKADLKLVKCERMWQGSDADENSELLQGVTTHVTRSTVTECTANFHAPTLLANQQTCREEAGMALLTGFPRFVACDEQEPDKYDGCMCDAMDSLTEDGCSCVDLQGNPIDGTLTFVKDGFENTCRSMDCANSRYDSSQLPPASASLDSSNAVLSLTLSQVAICAALLTASLLAIIAFARRRQPAAVKSQSTDASHARYQSV